MKNNKNKIVGLVASALLMSNAFALTAGGPAGPTGQAAQVNVGPITGVPAPEVVTPRNVGLGNVFEKETTPLLREISRKKSALEIRKLDRELEKLDEDALKAQAEREKANNPVASSVPVPTPQFAPQANSNAPQNAISSNGAIHVLMTYGSDNDLYAKIAMGGQGGYPVRRGDVLPDGRIVAAVYPNYIEVKKAAKSKKGGSVEKIFVTGSPNPSNNGAVAGLTPTMAPMLAVPSSMPATPGTVLLPTAGRK